MDKNIIAFFSDSGTPATGLSPSIKIRKVSDGSVVIASGSMSEVGDGWYKYNFTQYTSSLDYAIRCDGGTSLDASDRYMFAGNDSYVNDIWGADLSDHNTDGTVGSAINFLYNVQGGRWRIVGNQMIFYKDDNTTEVARFDLFDAAGSPTTINPFERRRT